MRRKEFEVADAVVVLVLQEGFDSPYVPPLDLPTGAEIRSEVLKEPFWSVLKPRFEDQVWKRVNPVKTSESPDPGKAAP